MMKHCSNCNTPVNDNFCSHCGQPVQLKRVDGRYILHEIQHVLHFEKGLFYTIKELLIRPGQNIRVFISENRSRLVKPVLFIIVTSLIYTIINKLFHIEEGYVDLNHHHNSAVPFIFHWIQNHYGYANILMGVFIALWLKLFYRAQAYNFFELLILLCFVMGIGMLLSAVFALVEGFSHVNLMLLSEITGILYCSWATAQFFHKRGVLNYLKALVSYLAGMVTFYISALLLGVLIDLFV